MLGLAFGPMRIWASGTMVTMKLSAGSFETLAMASASSDDNWSMLKEDRGRFVSTRRFDILFEHQVRSEEKNLC